MSTATHVPETSSFRQEELSADDARATLAAGRSLRSLLADSCRRMRYGDGFSQRAGPRLPVRALPDPAAHRLRRSGVDRQRREARPRRCSETILSILPGGSYDAFKQALTRGLSQGGGGGRVALVVGLVVALVVAHHGDGADRARREPDLRHPARPPEQARSTAAPRCSS